MNLNMYDADLHIQRQKELAQAAADSYRHARLLPKRNLRLVYSRALIAVGDRLVDLGYRLRGEFVELSAAPDLVEPLRFSRNGTNAG